MAILDVAIATHTGTTHVCWDLQVEKLPAGSWNTLKLLAGFTASLLQIFFVTTCMLSQKFSPSAFSFGTCRYNRIFFKPTRRYKYSYYFFLLNPQIWWEGSCFFPGEDLWAIFATKNLKFHCVHQSLSIVYIRCLMVWKSFLKFFHI